MENPAGLPPPIKATCHCGAISVTAPTKPKIINHCQCTICRRYAAAWAYYSTKVVEISAKPGAVTRQYLWGSRSISFNFCDTCGCMMYWYPYSSDREKLEDGGMEMGLNTRMVDPDELRYINHELSFEDFFAPVNTKAEH